MMLFGRFFGKSESAVLRKKERERERGWFVFLKKQADEYTFTEAVWKFAFDCPTTFGSAL